MWRTVLVSGLLLAAHISAAEELRTFESQQQRERYQALIEELRCPQCQNQNLEDSDSPIAQDLRNTVFRLLQEGMSDREIVDYMVQRYGDFITYLPRVQRSTLLLWLAPVALLFVGGGVLILVRRQRQPLAKGGSNVGADSGELSAEEQQKLDVLLNKKQVSSKQDGSE